MQKHNHFYQQDRFMRDKPRPLRAQNTSIPPADQDYPLSKQPWYPNDYVVNPETEFYNSAFPPTTTANTPPPETLFPGSLGRFSNFKPSNAPVETQDTTTVSSFSTNLGIDAASPTFEGTLPPNASTNYQPTPTKLRHDSLYVKEQEPLSNTSQTVVGRRRKSEFAEPGSARAIYLEKNRKAASKCRSKQKQEQEALVERARDVERRNRILRSEVDLLQEELRSIKDIVAQHAGCPDRRLGTYLQLQADRLARGEPSAGIPLYTSFQRTSFGENISPTTSYFPSPISSGQDGHTSAQFHGTHNLGTPANPDHR
jgi:cyclic AMP-dependent transcription factor ATF-2